MKTTLVTLKQAGDAAKRRYSSPSSATRRRNINVLDALAIAGIGNVTFTVSEDDQ